MSIVALREKRTMKSDEFISSLLDLDETLDKGLTSLRELKAIYYTINLDYIRLCETIENRRYIPSRNCDLKIRQYSEDADLDIALKIVRQRIDEIINSLT